MLNAILPFAKKIVKIATTRILQSCIGISRA